ncbi:MAG TPA: hypothetical protein VL172_22825, partial [Kofleriaceae bacterium]|nr:hypothetical protein [Kofleriaceae bacterium]
MSQRFLLLLLAAGCGCSSVVDAGDPVDGGGIDGDLTVTVAGRVVGRMLESPGQPFPVLLRDARGDRPMIDTDVDGSFVVEGVLPPYDLLVQVGTRTWVFEGLSRPDPLLQVSSIDPPPLHTVHWSGSIKESDGTTTTTLATGETGWLWFATDTLRSGQGLGKPGPLDVDTSVQWYGAGATTQASPLVIAYAYELADGIAYPTSYQLLWRG